MRRSLIACPSPLTGANWANNTDIFHLASLLLVSISWRISKRREAASISSPFSESTLIIVFAAGFLRWRESHASLVEPSKNKKALVVHRMDKLNGELSAVLNGQTAVSPACIRVYNLNCLDAVFPC